MTDGPLRYVEMPPEERNGNVVDKETTEKAFNEVMKVGRSKSEDQQKSAHLMIFLKSVTLLL